MDFQLSHSNISSQNVLGFIYIDKFFLEVPYHSYSKIIKKTGYSWKVWHISKDNQYFQLKLCVIAPKVMLSNMS